MPLSTLLHEIPIRVRYAETDAAGIAHHAAYLPWLEVGRVEWLRAAGLSYRDLEASGYSLPIIDLRVRYVAPVHFDDRLLIRTGLIDLRSRSLRFVYELVSAEEHPRQLANAMTRHVCVAGGSISPLPPELRALGE